MTDSVIHLQAMDAGGPGLDLYIEVAEGVFRSRGEHLQPREAAEAQKSLR